ncbi:MAG: CocE/NonD family hydrolase [Chloroflexi bacterium]|nr:CocE/NonD family hydrolase [Chloroflexota bacterium]
MRKRWMMVFLIGVVILFAGGIPVTAQESGGRTQMITMPDGTKLATDIYLPKGDGPWPVLLMRTPYGRNADGNDMGKNLLEAGIVLVSQDVRGRGDSEDVYSGFFAERADGQAMVDWILAQPWSNGRIATYGGSALGIAQYLLAPGAPEAVVCQWMDVSTPDVYQAVYQNGVYRSELVDGWLQGIGEMHLQATFREHTLHDGFWDGARITDFSQVNARAVHVGGWNDILARGTINGFLGYQNQGGPGAAGRQHLIMGPWTHGMNSSQIGELNMPAGALDYEGWFSKWLDACLMEGAFGVAEMDDFDALPAVTYFTMGAANEDGAPGNEWHTAETWPPAGGTDMLVYLHPNNHLDVEPPAENGGGDSFSYDPADPTPTIGGANLTIAAGVYDQREIEQREDVVVYSSTPLDQPLEITGDLRADIWIRTDVPDTDIVVRLTDVYPDGRSMLVLDSVMRARYHSSPDFSSEQKLEPGVPVLLSFDLGPTSIVFNAGHRIRVSISSSNAPRFLPNPNTGAMFLTEGESGQVAHTTILHDAAYPSAVILPVR